jgi:hypothetical protein
MIPVSDAVKTKVDVGVGSATFLGYFKAIPWPEIAAFLACVYTVLRIVEVVRDWKKKKK